MKHLKTFENQKNEPNEGDFVIIKLGLWPHANGEPLSNYLIKEIESSIGSINYIDPNDGDKKYSILLYNENLENVDLWVDREEIIHFSDDEDYIEMMFDTEKFNL